MGRVYPTVFSTVCGTHREQDRLYEERCRSLRTKLVPKALGVPDDYHCSYPTTIALLNTIDALSSPLEKMYCIQDAMVHIVELSGRGKEVLRGGGGVGGVLGGQYWYYVYLQDTVTHDVKEHFARILRYGGRWPHAKPDPDKFTSIIHPKTQNHWLLTT